MSNSEEVKMKMKTLLAWMLLSLIVAFFPAEVTAQGVSVTLNKSSFVIGDTMRVACEVNAAEIQAQHADIYFALGTPDGTFYCLQANGLFGQLNRISPVLSDWTVTDIAPTPLFTFDFSMNIPAGTYAWYLILCKPGNDAQDINNWLAGDACQWKFDQYQEGLQQLRSEQQRNKAPDVPAARLTELVAGNSCFAFDLYQKIRTEAGNLFYSPYSISLALGMVSAGARNETESQLEKTLHFTLPACASITGSANKRKKGLRISCPKVLSPR